MYAGNIATIEYGNNYKYHEKTKHIEINYHFVKIRKEQVVIKHVPAHQMVVDRLNKPLSVELFKTHIRTIGL